MRATLTLSVIVAQCGVEILRPEAVEDAKGERDAVWQQHRQRHADEQVHHQRIIALLEEMITLMDAQRRSCGALAGRNRPPLAPPRPFA